MALGYRKMPIKEKVVAEVEGIGYQRVALISNKTMGAAKNNLIFIDIPAH